MGGNVGADGIRMPHIQEARRHALQLETVDEMGRRLQAHVAEMDFVPTGLIQKTRDEGADFSGSEHQHTIHDRALYSTVMFRPRGLNIGATSGRQLDS